ncbi:TetR/AcrR family transcriptional regulator [Nocardia fluminea]|uniref:TetR/AcrR family transcriptional regulator n=1 Tax=Nocardia fluminea TaxID=134984 RepID=UPI0038179940
MSDSSLAPLIARALVDPGPELTTMDQRILDATLELYAAYGNRFSMDDVARRANVGRRTAFRRFGSKDGVVSALFVREAGSVLQMMRHAAAAAPDPASGAVEIFVNVVRRAATHPAMARMVRHESQKFIEYLRSGEPPLLDTVSAFVAEQIRSAQRKAGALDPDPERAADILIRLTLGFLLVPSRVVDGGDGQALRALAKTVIDPLFAPPVGDEAVSE